MDLVFLLIAVVLLTGLLFGKLARVFKMPNVTGYLVGGVVLILLFKLFYEKNAKESRRAIHGTADDNAEN